MTAKLTALTAKSSVDGRKGALTAKRAIDCNSVDGTAIDGRRLLTAATSIDGTATFIDGAATLILVTALP